MTLSFKPLRDQVIVITGASSGIGLATAKAAASRGARLVLASRNDEALTRIVEEINSAKGRAVHVTADVGSREELERVANTAIETFGGFDTWVNNAGISIYGRLEEVTEEDSQRLFQTNFWGVVHGSLVAINHLKQRGGTLINLGSVASDQGHPLQGYYSASKHAVKGFTEALRLELEAESAPVSVTLIKPTAIDTPFPQHAKNYMAQEPKLPSPIYQPSEVAHAILYAATHAKRDIYVGGSAKLMGTVARVAPHLMDRVAEPMMTKGQVRDEPPRDPEGALYHPTFGGQIRGDHPGYVMRRSFYTRGSLHPALTGTLLAAAGIAAAAMVRSSRRRRAGGVGEF